MGNEQLIVKMLGDFSIEWNGKQINDGGNRMRKIWLLLAYLIYRRGKPVSQSELISLLWENGEEQSNVQGSLKTMLYRARTMLDELGEGCGHLFIRRSGGKYEWNGEIPVYFDAAEFDALYLQGCKAEAEDEKLDFFTRALELYRGEFLSRLSMESWVVPISAYYHKIFLKMAEETLALMEKRSMWEQGALLCRRALKLEPYSENLYCHLMRNHLATGNQAAVSAVYEEMSDLLFSNFGVMPSEEARSIYREALSFSGGNSVPVSGLRDQLREEGDEKGALFCEYDYFKTLYRLNARTIARTGDTIHIALLSVHGKNRENLSRKSLDKIMGNLKDIAISNLRQGDVVTQCSVSQLIMMLPQANYENSCMVCARILRAFFRRYPHSPADISFSVQPLEPRA